MSEPEEASVTCGACGHSQPFTVWSSLNVTLDKELKQELLDRRLTSSTCGQCGNTTEVVYPLLYHDMGQKLMIWLWPEPGDPDYGDTRQFRIMKGYRFRIVRTINELVEKILVFDENCDDHEVEIFKFLLRGQRENDSDPLDGTLYFLGIQRGEDGEDILGFEHVRESGSKSFGLPMSVYRDAVASFRRDIRLEEPKRGTWLRVDADFIHALVTEASQLQTQPAISTGGPMDGGDDEPF